MNLKMWSSFKGKDQRKSCVKKKSKDTPTLKKHHCRNKRAEVPVKSRLSFRSSHCRSRLRFDSSPWLMHRSSPGQSLRPALISCHRLLKFCTCWKNDHCVTGGVSCKWPWNLIWFSCSVLLNTWFLHSCCINY